VIVLCLISFIRHACLAALCARVQPMNGGVGGGSTSAVMAVGDVDRDSVSSDSGRGPSEDEFRASSSLRSQHPPPPPVHRIHNGQRAHLL